MTHIDQLHHRVQWTDPDGRLTPFAFKFLVNMWEKVGGPDDFIEDLQNGELYESGTTDSKLTETIKQLDELENLVDLTHSDPRIDEIAKQVNELELLLELQGKESKIKELENRIKDLEMQVEMLSIPSLMKIESRLNEIETDLEMNYGA